MSETIEVRPTGPVLGRVCVPASKSLTNRALVLAALANGRSRLKQPLASDDTERLVGALEGLGVGIQRVPAEGPREPGHQERGEGLATSGSGSETRDLLIDGRGGHFLPPAGALDVGGSGTAMRFLTALAALVPGEVVIDGDSRMRQRPIGPLLDALRALGVEAASVAGNGRPPVRVRGGALDGGSVRLTGGISSQFVSALSMIAPFAKRGVVLEVAPPVVSRPYIDLTVSSMARFGAV